jgi:hypothetical protein
MLPAPGSDLALPPGWQRGRDSAQSMAASCAAGLRARMAAGETLTQAERVVLECCERHIGAGQSEAALMRAFAGVPAEALPPGMRDGGV